MYVYFIKKNNMYVYCPEIIPDRVDYVTRGGWCCGATSSLREEIKSSINDMLIKGDQIP